MIVGYVLTTQVAVHPLDTAHDTLFLQLPQLLVISAEAHLCAELRKTAPQHILHTQSVDPQQIENHGVCEAKLGFQLSGTALKQ